jgi:hypothetical protein
MTMNSEGYIEVLWIDDEWENQVAFRELCLMENIMIHPFKYANDGLARIKENPKRWDLILLDAQGLKAEGMALGQSGLISSVNAIKDIGFEIGIKIPYFIFTGQENLLSSEDFLASYDKTCIFSKGTDMLRLIQCIKELVSSREDMVVKDLYPKVFEAVNFLGLKESEQKLLGFLKAVHYKEYRLHRTPITDLRIILEELFHALIKPEIGLIPQECYKSDKRELNMADVILYMSGEQTKSEFGKAPAYGGLGVVDLEGPIYPALMSSFINTLYVYVSATDSHVKRIIDDEKTEIKNQCMQYSAKVEGSYIGFSFAYQICDVLTYTAAYVKNHPDPVLNRCRVYQLRDDHNSGCKIETTDGIMHYGKYCWADSSEFNDGESLNLKKIKLETTPKGVFKYKISKKK